MPEKILGYILAGKTPPIVLIGLVNLAMLFGVYQILTVHIAEEATFEKDTRESITEIHTDLTKIHSRFETNELFIYGKATVTDRAGR